MAEDLAGTRAGPFLRWAGGKSWLVPYLNEMIPEPGIGNYHEPFLGGGAIFFDVRPKGTAYLSDLNSELMDTYKAVRDRVEQVIYELGLFKNTKECYYKVRSQSPRSAAARAARFIFLNQTSFNGIYRVNLKGEYNVPYGHRKKEFLQAESLRAASETLAGTDLFQGDFDEVRKSVSAGDFVFLDPPYTVSHNNNGFVKYNQKLFCHSDQLRLRDLVEHLERVGAWYVLTNAAHVSIAEIFDGVTGRRVELSRISRVGGKEAPRGRFSEYLFTNLDLP